MTETTDPNAHLPRTAPRHRALKSARIVFNSDFSTVDAVIRDESDSGVRLKLGSPFAVPHLFDMLIQNPKTGTSERRACETRWQRGDQVGARFLTPVAKTDATPAARPSLRRKPIGA